MTILVKMMARDVYDHLKEHKNHTRIGDTQGKIDGL
jgi:hypothetical protein